MIKRPGPAERYTKDLEAYLLEKLKDKVTIAELQEIAAYIGNKTSVLVFDMINARDRQWNAQLKKGTRRYREKPKGENQDD